MDRGTGILVGVAGAGIAVAVGYRIYQAKCATQNQTPPPTTMTKAPTSTPHPRTSTIFNWKERYQVKYIPMVEKVLYNSVDSLSVYGHSAPEIFLDLVYYVDQYCLLYLNSQMTPHDPYWITKSARLQTSLFNAVGLLESRVQMEYPLGQKGQLMLDFSERSQMIINILNSYHVNIIRQVNNT
jgi:hypothetical protein